MSYINTTNISTEGSGAISRRVIVPLWMSLTGLLICSFTAFLNFAFLVLLFKTKNLRQRTGIYLILCLCVSDMFAGTAGVVFSITYLIPGLPSNRPFCTFHMLLYITGIVMSIGQTFIISLHRFLVAKGVRWHHYLGKNRVLVSVFVFIQASFVSTIAIQEDTIAYCEVSVLYGDRYPYFAFVIVIFTLPFIVLTLFLYLTAVFMIRQRFRKTDIMHETAVSTLSSTQPSREFSEVGSQPNQQSINRPDSSEGNKKIAKVFKTVGIILAVFCILTVPIVMVIFLELIGVKIERQVRLPASFLPLINSILNPFIYTFRLEEVKREIKNRL